MYSWYQMKYQHEIKTISNAIRKIQSHFHKKTANVQNLEYDVYDCYFL